MCSTANGSPTPTSIGAGVNDGAGAVPRRGLGRRHGGRVRRPLLVDLFAELLLVLRGQDVGHPQLVADEEQGHQPEGDQRLADAAGERAGPVAPPTRREARRRPAFRLLVRRDRLRCSPRILSAEKGRAEEVDAACRGLLPGRRPSGCGARPAVPDDRTAGRWIRRSGSRDAGRLRSGRLPDRGR